MTGIETKQLVRPRLSKPALDCAQHEFGRLSPVQQDVLSSLRGSDYRSRGAILAYLHLIQQEMPQSGWTNRELGEALGVSEQAVSQWFKTGEIEARHLTRIMSHELLGICRVPTAVDCDVQSYRAGVGWVRRLVLAIEVAPKHVPSFEELALLIAMHASEESPFDAAVSSLPEAYQSHYRGWDRKSKATHSSRLTKTLEKWGSAYRLFVLEEYHRG